MLSRLLLLTPSLLFVNMAQSQLTGLLSVNIFGLPVPQRSFTFFPFRKSFFPNRECKDNTFFFYNTNRRKKNISLKTKGRKDKMSKGRKVPAANGLWG